ncbi:unnamed protein product [Tuber melanosporum]|uniref:Sister chromatid cohesion protein n=1 Tax=Tuber melanosporum (strain Mel28) TaxID=656061 RepID=D5GD01_TUBMM|nr:uncharacterized protein GSTUM_00006034001 [Tuber melanosporum]CAZ82394.1 unnamed protein product [Tuber melanosporum]
MKLRLKIRQPIRGERTLIRTCVPALVALETSANVAIQAISNREHRMLHSKHETIVERGYMDGVLACYIYQRNVIGNGSGATANPFTSKMHPLYEIAKSSRKVRKKLLGNMTMSVDFESPKLYVDPSKPNHLGYSKFVLENLAFFEYGTFDELYQVVTTMERVVSGTGITVAHSIETDILLLKLDSGDTTERIITPDTLKLLATSAAILFMLWECRYFLRKSYSINDNKSRDYKSNKLSAKDANKAPSRAATWSNGAATLWKRFEEIMTDLKSDEGMMKQCKEFVDLLTVDNEFKLAAEGEDPEDLDGERALTPIHDLQEEGGIGGELGTPGNNKKRKFTSGSPEKGLMRPKKKVKAKPWKSAGKDE